MKLKKWALLAKILSAVAVVTSLVFVGLQINQSAEETALNTRVIQTSAYQDLTAQINALSALIIANPQFAELVQRGKPESPQEQRQLSAFSLSMFRHGELAYLQFENDLINEDSLRNMLSPLHNTLNTNATARGLWQNLPISTLNPRYRDFVNASREDLNLD